MKWYFSVVDATGEISRAFLVKTLVLHPQDKHALLPADGAVSRALLPGVETDAGELRPRPVASSALAYRRFDNAFVYRLPSWPKLTSIRSRPGRMTYPTELTGLEGIPIHDLLQDTAGLRFLNETRRDRYLMQCLYFPARVKTPGMRLKNGAFLCINFQNGSCLFSCLVFFLPQAESAHVQLVHARKASLLTTQENFDHPALMTRNNEICKSEAPQGGLCRDPLQPPLTV